MRYLSVCSGIEAATVAWHPLGWTPVAFSEIEPFPSAVLKHHYPEVPNLGDMTQHAAWPLQPGDIDLLVGGTPCQSFSVAGLRKGLSDPRGGLMLTYLEIARRLRPRWVVWENVPGVLSSGRGRDFGSFLGALGDLGYGWAYRVLDAQWVRTQRHPRAVPQRRRRVFVVGCLGDAAAAASVLFERESVCRNPAARASSRQGAAVDAESCSGTFSSKWSKGTGGYSGASEHANLVRWPAEICATLNAKFGEKLGLEDQHALSGAPMFVPVGNWWDGSDCVATLTRQKANGSQRMPDKDNFGAVLQPIVIDRAAFNQGEHAQYDPIVRHDDAMPSMVARGPHAVATIDMQACKGNANIGDGSVSPTLCKPSGSDVHAVAFDWQQGNDVTNPRPSTMNVFKELTPTLGTTRTPAVAHGFYSTGGTHGLNHIPEVSPAVKVGSGLGIPSPPAVAFSPGNLKRGAGAGPNEEVFPTLKCSAGRGADDQRPCVAEVTQQVAALHAATMTVRRLTPRECERLQAFPDDYTMIPWRGKSAADCPDGPRYKALGNSMAVNCMEWIGERIAAWEARNDR